MALYPHGPVPVFWSGGGAGGQTARMANAFGVGELHERHWIGGEELGEEEDGTGRGMAVAIFVPGHGEGKWPRRKRTCALFPSVAAA
jgi:hypothetical protein